MSSEPSDGSRGGVAASTHPELPFAGTLVADKYVIETILGAGGMGVVFAATHRVTGRRLALKWLLPELSVDVDSVDRFLREAQFAGGIDHPNVIAILDVGFHGDSAFIVMEYLHGEPLSQVLDREPRLPMPDGLSILVQAMRGVAAAHARNILHRDLKPENIFLCRYPDGSLSHVKVLDFGISKMISTNATDPALTQSGVMLGTPDYMPVEQFRAQKDLDERIDVYAFGIMLYEALTGKLPYEGLTFGELAVAVSIATPERPRKLCKEISPQLEHVILKAMALERDDRYATVNELIAALEPFQSTDPRPVPPTSVPPAPRSKRAPRWAVGCALVIGTLAVWFWSRDRGPAHPAVDTTLAPAALALPIERVVAPIATQLTTAIDAGIVHAPAPSDPSSEAQTKIRAPGAHPGATPAAIKVPLVPIPPTFIPSPPRAGPLRVDDF